MDVVGTMFFKDRKLLIDKPRKRCRYQMVGGKIEEGETPLKAAIRECHEELGGKVKFNNKLFELVMEFEEISKKDKETIVHFYVFKYNGTLGGILKTSDEIENFRWYDTSQGTESVSNALRNEVIPYCLREGLID